MTPKDGPFPVGVLELRAREWEREGRPSGAIRSCGERCYALEEFTWGRVALEPSELRRIAGLLPRR